MLNTLTVDAVKNLKRRSQTVSIMESCTGGGLSNQITNTPGSSDVFKFSAVTYSNEYKVKMGVSNDLIEQYSVYSMQVADEMSKKISEFSNSNYAIGVTGKLNCKDSKNSSGDDNKVYISVYIKERNIFLNKCVKVKSKNREKNKKTVIKEAINMLCIALQ